MNLALMEGRQRLIKQGVTEVEADDLRARTYRLAKSWVLSARDRLAGEFGMTVRPNRLVKAGWFVRAVPDQIDQQLVIDTVYFARSYDAPAADGQPFPYAALGRKHKITADAARDRLLAALVRLGELKAEWLDANIFLPMSRRLSEGQDDGDLSNTGYTDHEFERVDDPEAWAHEHG